MRSVAQQPDRFLYLFLGDWTKWCFSEKEGSARNMSQYTNRQTGDFLVELKNEK